MRRRKWMGKFFADPEIFLRIRKSGNDFCGSAKSANMRVPPSLILLTWRGNNRYSQRVQRDELETRLHPPSNEHQRIHLVRETEHTWTEESQNEQPCLIMVGRGNVFTLNDGKLWR